MFHFGSDGNKLPVSRLLLQCCCEMCNFDLTWSYPPELRQKKKPGEFIALGAGITGVEFPRCLLWKVKFRGMQRLRKQPNAWKRRWRLNTWANISHDKPRWKRYAEWRVNGLAL